MQTLRQEISNIRGSGKLLTSDILISDRFIASLLRNAANTIVSQSLDKRKLWQSPNIFTPILCLEMEKVPLTECCEYEGDRQVAVSKKSLPQIGEGTWGLAIQGVFGMDMSKSFKETTPKRFANLLKLVPRSNNIYYWIQNGHLYVSNEDTELVNFFAYFTEDVPNHLLFPGKDCKCSVPPDITDLCVNPLDKPFRFPANRISDIENMVFDKLNGTFFRRTTDTTSDNKED